MTAIRDPLAGTVLDRLVRKAMERSGQIEPCDGKTLDECVTHIRGGHQLWYNTPADRSTRMVEIAE